MNAQHVATIEREPTNAMANTPVKPVDSVRAALEKMRPQMAMALPKHITPERMLRVTMSAVQVNPKLLECDRTSLFSAVMSCCQLGLEPDGVLGQAYLIPFSGRVQFIPGYKGLIALARNSGEVISIEAHEVCENDDFDFAFGLNGRLEHVPARGNRGAVTHFWAMARFKDGGYHYDVMTKEEVDAIRARSPGKNSDPWKIHYNEMGKKTVIRRIAKYLPLSVQKAVAIEAAYESGRPASTDAHGDIVIEAAKPESSGEIIDATTGEVLQAAPSALEQFEAEAAAAKQPAEPENAPAERPRVNNR